MNFLEPKAVAACEATSNILQLIVFSIFMLFVPVSNGATSFCSMRLISEATKQNSMGHTTNNPKRTSVHLNEPSVFKPSP